ncbi:MAG: type II secretion system protein J [Burkholderiales bacterium]
MKVSSQKGFTLVEVLVALMVMAILATMAWQGVDGMVRARDATQQRLGSNLQLGTVMAQWDVDLAAVQDSGVIPPLGFDGASLRLTRRTDTGMQLVVWSLKPDAAGNTRWLRWASPIAQRSNELQDHWLRSQQFQGGEAGQLEMLSGVSQWQLYYYRVNAWTNAQSSGDVSAVDVAASAGANTTRQRERLPTGVRLVLTFAPGSGRDGQLTRDIALGPQP